MTQRILRFCDAHGKRSVARLFESRKLFQSGAFKRNRTCAVDFPCNAFYLFCKGHIGIVERTEIRFSRIAERARFFGKRNRSLPSLFPAFADGAFRTRFRNEFGEEFEFFARVRCELVDRDDRAYAEFADVFDMRFEI